MKPPKRKLPPPPSEDHRRQQELQTYPLQAGHMENADDYLQRLGSLRIVTPAIKKGQIAGEILGLLWKEDIIKFNPFVSKPIQTSPELLPAIDALTRVVNEAQIIRESSGSFIRSAVGGAKLTSSQTVANRVKEGLAKKMDGLSQQAEGAFIKALTEHAALFPNTLIDTLDGKLTELRNAGKGKKF